MQLDDLATLQTLDPQGMLNEIRALPDQLEKAWEIGSRCTLPDPQGIQRVAIAGMGGSAIGADLLAAYISALCRVPVAVVREYDLPAWAAGNDTLFIASSHSGNTEETLSAFQQAKERGCRLVSLSTGGELEKLTNAIKAPLWKFEHHGQPRAAVGYSFGLLLSLFTRLNLIPDPAKDLAAAAALMRKLQANYQPEQPVARNAAKRQAGQLVGRWVTV
ncbi:MAG TPA: SIS domain-containing protein, partial [Longilinea sp.]|nr:SIS domain-containing protein [Longilinea sp.]